MNGEDVKAILNLFYSPIDVECDYRKCPNNTEGWDPTEGSNTTQCKVGNRHYRVSWDCREKYVKLGIAWSNNRIEVTNAQKELIKKTLESVASDTKRIGE